MTTEAFVQNAVENIWKMKRHTVCAYCDRYKPTDKFRMCRACAVKYVRDYFNYADTTTENHTHESESHTQ